jgi:tetratricopeptide (TPR) repeat protein
MKILLTFFLSLSLSVLFAQPNCNYFLQTGDTLKFEACEVAEKRRGHYQFSKEFQIALDKSIEIDPSFAYAYRAKSVAYLKSGNFLEWKRLIDLAVKYDATQNMGYRASCRYQFFRDYAGAIADIEEFDRITTGDIGHSANGNYHLNVVRALCYKALGRKEKAIEIMETQMATEDYMIGIYDYIHLGVLYLETGNMSKARLNFERQLEYNDLAENHFYMVRVMKALGENAVAKKELDHAIVLYKKGYVLADGYVHPEDKIFWSMIEKEQQELND